MHEDAVKIVEQLPNDPGGTPQTCLRRCYKGLLPDSMCEVPYLLVAEIDSIRPTSDSEAALSGMFSYGTNPTLHYQVDFTGMINFISRELSLTEHRTKPEEEFAYSGRLSANGRVMYLHAQQADGFHSDPFYLIDVNSIEYLMRLEKAGQPR